MYLSKVTKYLYCKQQLGFPGYTRTPLLGVLYHFLMDTLQPIRIEYSLRPWYNVI